MISKTTLENNMRLSKSIVGQKELKAIADVILKDGYLGMGETVALFEQELGSFLGIPSGQVLCVSSGTAALQLAVQAVTQPGDEVLVPSLTFISSFQAISATGAIPVACDVNTKTGTLDIYDAQNRLTKCTRVIMPVHYASNPGNLDEIYSFAKKNKLRVIEDAAHAFGCSFNGKQIGSFGDMICFSFDGIKNITSGEGGAVITEDQKVIKQVKDARLLGIENDTEKRFSGDRSWEFDVTRQGYRYHMSNLFAAVGRTQLSRLSNEFGPKRIKLAKLYREQLVKINGIQLFETQLESIIPHIQPIRVLNNRRNELRSALSDQGIQTGIHYKPNHLLSLYGGGRASLPVCERLYNELLSLPLHPGLTLNNIDKVCRVIAQSMNC